VHDLHRIREYDRIDPLEDIGFCGAVLIAEGHAVGCVDVAVCDDIKRIQCTGQPESRTDFSDCLKHSDSPFLFILAISISI
jgi:hypothetical protein